MFSHFALIKIIKSIKILTMITYNNALKNLSKIYPLIMGTKAAFLFFLFFSEKKYPPSAHATNIKLKINIHFPS